MGASGLDDAAPGFDRLIRNGARVVAHIVRVEANRRLRIGGQPERVLYESGDEGGPALKLDLQNGTDGGHDHLHEASFEGLPRALGFGLGVTARLARRGPNGLGFGLSGLDDGPSLAVGSEGFPVDDGGSSHGGTLARSGPAQTAGPLHLRGFIAERRLLGMRVGIIGAGYTGQFLARRLIANGHSVMAGRRSNEGLEGLRSAGAETRSVDLSDGRGLDAFGTCDVLVHLAPPPELDEIEGEVARMAGRLGSIPLVYGSTTGAFGRQPAETWIDEDTASGPLQPRGRRRVAYAEALTSAGFAVRRVFIAGIYGPGRSMFESLQRGLVLFEGGPSTSRVHVEDLAELLEAQLGPDGVDRVIACDEAPAPTLEVARFAAELAGWTLPPVLTLEAAKAEMSEMAKELRLNGRKCRSLHRPRQLPRLRYPSYREGLRACWLSRS